MTGLFDVLPAYCRSTAWDGVLVQKVAGGQTTVYVGPHYEKNLTTGVVTKYYYLGGQRVAMVQNGTPYYLHSDHLGSASLVTVPGGGVHSQMRYYAYGEVRASSGTVPTDRRFTGQREETGLGLYDYAARRYDPLLGRFIQADTIVPSLRPGDLNRYSYTRNNPLRYTDPSGHVINLAFAGVGALVGGAIGAVASAGPQVIRNIQSRSPLATNIDLGEVAKEVAIGAAVGAVGGLTFGLGLAAGGALAGAVGVSSASGASATAIGMGTVALSSAAAGQTSRAADNVIRGRPATQGLGQVDEMLLDAAAGMVFFKAGGGNFSQIAPSDITGIGAYGRESIPSSGRNVSRSESAQVQILGDMYGCHTCGTMQPGGSWVGDHQPPASVPSNTPRALFPQCPTCSARQGGYLRWERTDLVYHIRQGAWRPYYSWGPAWELWDQAE